VECWTEGHEREEGDSVSSEIDLPPLPELCPVSGARSDAGLCPAQLNGGKARRVVSCPATVLPCPFREEAAGTESPFLHGLLRCKAKFGRWRRQWFVFDRETAQLRQYGKGKAPAEKAASSSGAMRRHLSQLGRPVRKWDIKRCKIQDGKVLTDKPLCICVTKRGKKSTLLQVPSPEVFQQWFTEFLVRLYPFQFVIYFFSRFLIVNLFAEIF
jgi:hypothetical protein